MFKLLIFTFLAFGVNFSLYSENINCSIRGKSELFYKVACRTSAGTREGYVDSILKLESVSQNDQYRYGLDNNRLFDLNSGSYLNSESIIAPHSIKGIEINKTQAAIFSNKNSSSMSWGCRWKNNALKKLKLKDCQLCFGSVVCNFGKGNFETKAYCKDIEAGGMNVCPAASECYSSNNVTVREVSDQRQREHGSQRGSSRGINQ